MNDDKQQQNEDKLVNDPYRDQYDTEPLADSVPLPDPLSIKFQDIADGKITKDQLGALKTRAQTMSHITTVIELKKALMSYIHLKNLDVMPIRAQELNRVFMRPCAKLGVPIMPLLGNWVEKDLLKHIEFKNTVGYYRSALFAEQMSSGAVTVDELYNILKASLISQQSVVNR